MFRFRKISCAYLILFLTICSIFAYANNPKYRHFIEIESSLPKEDDNRKIRLIKIFAYECKACKKFEMKFAQWLPRHARHLNIQHIPLSVLPKNYKENGINQTEDKNQVQEIGRLPRMVYSLMAMDKNIFTKYPLLSKKIFDQTLVGDEMLFNNKFLNEEVQAAFLEKEFGINKKQFLDNFRSRKNFYIDTQVHKDNKIIRQIGIDAVPSIVVAGKWLIIPNESSSSTEKMLDDIFSTLDKLIEKEKNILN